MSATDGNLRYPEDTDPVNIPGDLRNLAEDVDSTKAPLESPSLTGIPTAPTAEADTSTTQIATTAFVVGQAATSTPASIGAAAAGTSKKFARADHVHALSSTSVLTPTNLSNSAASSTASTAASGSSSNISRADHVHALHSHKSTHATGGTDALSPSDIGAVATTLTISAGAGLSGGGALSANRTLSVSFGTTTEPLGVSSAGTSNDVSRSDHVHEAPPIPTASTLGILSPLLLMGA